MNKIAKKIISIVLVLAMLAGISVCFASAETDKTYRNYDKLVLLGDSVAAGYDEKEWVNTEFVRVDHSYSAIVADTLGAELVPLACQGFRTIEMRYMFEDDFVPDEYLFHDTYDVEATEALKPEFRRQVADADLITLGLGGNDVGTYLSWVVVDAMAEDGALAPFIEAARKMLEELGFEDNGLKSLIDLADTMDALPALLKALPEAISFGVSNYLKNWNIVIEDIYDLNPDVTLVVCGLFDTGYANEEDFNDNSTQAVISHQVAQTIVDAINAPMKLNADKYGYIYVEMTKIICYGSHPTHEGYRRMAELILEALPEAEFPYDDVFANDWYYNAVKFVTDEGIMDGVTENTFAPDRTTTRAQFIDALYKMAGSPDVSGLKEPFFDINSDFWAYDAVVWAYNNGIIKGLFSLFFMPDCAISRAHLVTMLYRFAGSPTGSGNLNFYDRLLIPSYAKNAVMWAVSNGIVEGYSNGMFRPLKNITRAETAQIIANYCAG